MIFDLTVFVMSAQAITLVDMNGFGVKAELAFPEPVVQGRLFSPAKMAHKVCAAVLSAFGVSVFHVDYQKGSLALMGRFDGGAGTIAEVVPLGNCVAVVYANGGMARFDVSTMTVEKTGELKGVEVLAILHRDILVRLGGGQLGLFSLASLEVCLLLPLDFTQSNMAVAHESHVVSDCGQFMITAFTDGQGHWGHRVYAAGQGCPDMAVLAKRLLGELRISHAWTFRLCGDLRECLCKLFVVAASEGGKTAHLGTICRVLMLVARFTAGLDCTAIDFLNDLDRTVSLATALTGKTDKVVKQVEEMLSKGQEFAVSSDLFLPEDQLFSVVPLVQRMLFLTVQAYKDCSLLFALASFRRRVISLYVFAITIVSQAQGISMAASNPHVAEYANGIVMGLSGMLGVLGVAELTVVFKWLSANLLQSFAAATGIKAAVEQEMSVSVIHCLMTGQSEPVDFRHFIKSVFRPIEASMDSTEYDRVRCIPLSDSQPTRTCRLCLRRSLCVGPDLFAARWNEHFLLKCVCGGEWT